MPGQQYLQVLSHHHILHHQLCLEGNRLQLGQKEGKKEGRKKERKKERKEGKIDVSNEGSRGREEGNKIVKEKRK